MEEGKSPKDYARPETLKYLDKIKLYWEVGKGDSGVSMLPQVSFGYGYCGAIALLNGREGGLSHTDSDDGNILYHLDKMIGDFDVPPEELKAIPIAGKGMETLKRCCKDRGIKVVNEYQGDWYFDHLERMFYYPRDVLLVPSLREVIIYTREGKIHKLFDPFSDFSESKPYPNLLEREFSFWAL
ncbi:MAG: hypothetical protein KAW40_01845 [Candidatus Aenigmarchaeota archaeon]|nr:hypothetical protein [Candidatus Aenigmarchaeota archaeon]